MYIDGITIQMRPHFLFNFSNIFSIIFIANCLVNLIYNLYYIQLCCNILAAELYALFNPHQSINLYGCVLKFQLHIVWLYISFGFQLYYFVLFYVHIVLLLLSLLSCNSRNLMYCYNFIYLLCVRINMCTLKKIYK